MSDWQGARDRARAGAEAAAEAHRDWELQEARAREHEAAMIPRRMDEIATAVLRLRAAWLEAGMPGRQTAIAVYGNPYFGGSVKFRLPGRRRRVMQADLYKAEIHSPLEGAHDPMAFGFTTERDVDDIECRHAIFLVLIEHFGPVFTSGRVPITSPKHDISVHSNDPDEIYGLREVAQQVSSDEVLAALGKWCVLHDLRVD